MLAMKSGSRIGGQLNYVRLVLRLRIPFAIATMVLAVLGLLTNYAGIDFLGRPLGDGAATHPITALCLFGLGLCAMRLRRIGRASVWRYLLGLTIVTVCATRLMQAEVTLITGAPAAEFFGPIAGFQGRFSVESAIALGAFATSAILRQSLGAWGTIFLVIGAATVSNVVLELSYGLVFFNGDVGAFSLLGLICTCVAMTTCYVHRPLVRVCFLIGNIGSQTRTMVVAAIVIPWACGLFLHSVRDFGTGTAPIEAAMVSVITWSMLLVVLMSASRFENSDRARRRAEHEIVMKSRIDPLTKALNRFAMSEMLDTSWVNFKSSGALSGVLLLDGEYFRRVNETFGQGSDGDALERVASTVQAQLRDHDGIARWNDEEFLIILRVKAQSDFAIVVERLSAALSDPNGAFCAGLDGEPPAIVPMFGVGDMRDDDRGPADMIARADAGLHMAKDAVVNQVMTRYELNDLNEPLCFGSGFDAEPTGDVLKDADTQKTDEIAA